jgi:hypothetical protein
MQILHKISTWKDQKWSCYGAEEKTVHQVTAADVGNKVDCCHSLPIQNHNQPKQSQRIIRCRKRMDFPSTYLVEVLDDDCNLRTLI